MQQLCLRQSTQSGISSAASVAGNRNYTHFLRSRSFHRAGTISLDRPAGPLLLLCERSASDFEEAPYRVASELYGIAQILSERALGII